MILSGFMKIIISLLLTFIIGQSLFAQSQFQHRYGSPFSDYANRIIQTHDGNYVVVGLTNGFGSSGNAFIGKVNSTGKLLWLKDYAGINIDEAFDVLETADFDLVICGSTYSFGSGYTDGFIMKTDSLGNIKWAKAYGKQVSDEFYVIKEDTAGGYFVAGISTKANNNAQLGTALLRLDSVGNIIWERWVYAWSTQGSGNYPIDMTTTSSGDVLLTGVNHSNGEINCWKFSMSGSLIWSYGFDVRSASGLRFTENLSGDIFINYYTAGVAGSNDMALLKLNASGNILWSKSYGGTYVDWPTAITQTSDGGVAVSGITNSIGNGDYDSFILKVDSNGAVQWAKTYGTVWRERPTSVSQTLDGGYILCGQTFSYGSNADSLKVHVVKTDSLGETSCNYILWNPVVMDDTVALTASLVPDTIVVHVDTITWPVNNRTIYDIDMCNTTSVAGLDPEIGFSIYPNPFSSQIAIHIPGRNFDDYECAILNTVGQVVFRDKVIDNELINLQFLASGIYYLEVSSQVKQMFRVIIKQ